MKPATPIIIEIIAFILISIGINYEIVGGGDIGWLSICGGGILAAYGDMRHRIGKLEGMGYRIGKIEGKMDLISKNMKMIMDNNKKVKE